MSSAKNSLGVEEVYFESEFSEEFSAGGQSHG